MSLPTLVSEELLPYVPIAIDAVGDQTLSIKHLGEETDVPTLMAKTEAGDRLWILSDEESPLVLRMEEAGSELVRTITEVRILEDL